MSKWAEILWSFTKSWIIKIKMLKISTFQLFIFSNKKVLLQKVRHFSNWDFKIVTSALLATLGYIDSMLISRFLRSLRSKDVQCWILRLRLWKFVIISESLAASLEKVRQSSVWQKVPKFWFICLFYCSSKTYSCK